MSLEKHPTTFLDHLYTNVIEKVHKVGLLICDATDHLPILATIRSSKWSNETKEDVYVRDFSKVDKEAFNQSIRRFANICDDSMTVSDKMRALQDHLVNCVDEHAALRKLTRREKKFRPKPWISRGLQTSIELKNNMYNRITKHNEAHLKGAYNKYKKKIEKLTFLAKRRYLANKIDVIKGNSKALWKIINEIHADNQKIASLEKAPCRS